LDIAAHTQTDKLPKIFYVNWFRRSEDGAFLWPGFGENIRVLKWALQRLAGTADAVRTPIGDIPAVEYLDLDGIDTTRYPREVIHAALHVDAAHGRTKPRTSMHGSPASVITTCPKRCMKNSRRSNSDYTRDGPTVAVGSHVTGTVTMQVTSADSVPLLRWPARARIKVRQTVQRRP
ncbi:MAG: phosphoenolpyruvate carboxykinase domain-containing protein, partial [Mycobacterium sp.]